MSDKKKEEVKPKKDNKDGKEKDGRTKPHTAAKAHLKPTKLCSAPDFPYHNRELSWMDFNSRVLEEAFEKENPILERLNFLAITASNLDEFFMVRVAGVMDRMHSPKGKKPDESGMGADKQFELLTEKIHDFAKKQYSCLNRSLIPALRKNKLRFLKMEELNKNQRAQTDKYFDKFIFPILTPLAVDTSRPFPLLMNKSLNIAVRLSKEGEDIFAVVQVPSIVSRYFEVERDGVRSFVMLEDIIIAKLPQLFELYKIKAYLPFRITRDGDLDIDEEADDLLVEIKHSLKKRQRGDPVRLEMSVHGDEALKNFLVQMLGVSTKEIYEVNGPLDLNL